MGTAADEVHVTVGVDPVTTAPDADCTAGHVEGIVQFSFINTVAVCRVDGVISGVDPDISAVNVDNSTFQTFIAVGHVDGRTVMSCFITDGQNMVCMDGIIRSVDGEFSAEQGHIIVGIDPVIDSFDIHGHTVNDNA